MKTSYKNKRNKQKPESKINEDFITQKRINFLKMIYNPNNY